MFTAKELEKLVFPATYRKGVLLQKKGRVRRLEEEITESLRIITGNVWGSSENIYRVKLELDLDKGKIRHHSCDCAAHATYSGLCKHCVALFLEWEEMNVEEEELEFPKLETLEERLARAEVRRGFPSVKEERKELVSEPGLLEILKPYLEEEPLETEVEGKVRLEPHLTVYGGNIRLSLKVGITQMYVVKRISQFASRVRRGESYYYGKKLEFVHRLSAFSQESRPLLDFILTQVQEPKSVYAYGNSRMEDSLEIRDPFLDSLMDILEPREFFASIFGFSSEKWVIQKEGMDFCAVLRGEKDGAVFSMNRFVTFQGAGSYYFVKNGVIHRLLKERLGKGLAFFEFIQRRSNRNCKIGRRELPVFLQELLPDLEKVFPVDTEELMLENFLPEMPEFAFYLDSPQKDMILCTGKASYSQGEYPLWKKDSGDAFIRRNRKEERKKERRVGEFFQAFSPEDCAMVLKGEEACYEFLAEGLESLQEEGEVYLSDSLKRMKVHPVPKVNVGISLTGNLLELSLESELPMKDLAEILSRYDRKKEYFRLKNGEFFRMEQEGVEQVQDLVQTLQISEKELKKGVLTLPKYRALYLDSKLKGSQGLSLDKSRSYRQLIRNMKTVEDNDFEVPKSLKPILREYQEKGFLWLKTLRQNGFGGILADDMGLGKTLQVIAFLLSEVEESGEGELRRTLIVAPASLVYNWENEIKRFAPGLSVKVLAGSKAERRSVRKEAGRDDILVTSYDLLKRDLEEYQEMEFFCQVIDEAQYIKNTGTKGARAVKAVRAGYKLALTGTPVENRLSELWSIFDYLMPGFLYPYERFKAVFETPIVKNQDGEALGNLQKMIRPFILRRLKKEVLKDLPDKIEKKMVVRMGKEQGELYQARAQRLKLLLEDGGEEEFGEIRMQILAELTRLRQLCCDPSLIYENYQGGSAKGDLFLELVQNAIQGGHKILVFSQFTSMLEILEKRLDVEKIPYYSLTGNTPKKERIQKMEAFNRDEVPVFCISLKAGGTGLNLTGADMVIHYDPWWNMAVENQATDRAHRIGQKNVVTVYKLVAEKTIEEKVVELQEKKRELADQILDGNAMEAMKFSREELLKLFEER